MDYIVKKILGRKNDKALTVSVPGSKSITARAMLIAALAKGKSVLYGVQFSDDCKTFLECLIELGISCKADGTTLTIEGCGGIIPKKQAEIYVGSAGTAARFLPAMLAFSDGEYLVKSSEQMKKRPIYPLINALKDLGAKFEFLENENCFPFKIKGTKTAKTFLEIDVEKSSQYLTALLISAVCAKSPMKIKSVGTHGMEYINMTLNMMWSFGVNVEEKDGEYTVFGEYQGKRYDIEPDVSAASYFYAMNRVLGTKISVKGIMPHSMQGDIKFIQLLKNFDGGKVDMHAFSDQALTLAAIAPFMSKPTHICGVKHIRGQECDRIKAIYENLTAMKVRCEEFEDGVKIYPSTPQAAEINTFGDHRVAMSFAVTGLCADGIVIKDCEVCSKTFKEYFAVLDYLIEKLTEN